MKRNLAGPSPKKAEKRKLSIEEDIFICLKSGISGRARRTIKSELIKRKMDIFQSTGAMESKKKELHKNANYEWLGEGESRALICRDVPAIMKERLNRLKSSGMLVPRHPGQITLVLTGDKGGIRQGTKIGLIVADVAHPNSPSNVTLVGYYEGDDKRFIIVLIWFDYLVPIWKIAWMSCGPNCGTWKQLKLLASKHQLNCSSAVTTNFYVPFMAIRGQHQKSPVCFAWHNVRSPKMQPNCAHWKQLWLARTTSQNCPSCQSQCRP